MKKSIFGTDETRRIINEMKSVASRTGNKQVEAILCCAAEYLQDFENEYWKVVKESEDLRKKLTDKDEQIAGWKALVDQMKTVKISVPEEPKRTQTIPKYNYTKLLSDFYASGEPQRFVQYLYGNENEHRVPRAAYCNKKARELSSKDIRAYHVGNGIMLMRTNLKEKGE